jgi:electron transfer flavoprotein alpha subunit
MTESILFLTHVEESGGGLPKAAFEVLGAALKLAQLLGSPLDIGLIGENAQTAADSFAPAGARRILGVAGTEFAKPRFASDAAAAEAICRATSPTLIFAPGTSRFLRALPSLAQRLHGQVDTHITSVNAQERGISATRWFYRQRLEGVFQREARPWILLLDSGCHEPWSGAPGQGKWEEVTVTLPQEAKRTSIAGVRVPKSGSQTIRPDAGLLFVAGAGWTKKQADGKVHPEQAEGLILNFLRASGASLGGSKSLVDQSGENQTVLGFMTHMNQVGQTGSTPRHPKGLSTCCHGEEPHVVGWRFISERRAINLDPNCGWARGKADVLYVADAFQVMAKVNSLLGAQSTDRERAEAANSK